MESVGQIIPTPSRSTTNAFVPLRGYPLTPVTILLRTLRGHLFPPSRFFSDPLRGYVVDNSYRNAMGRMVKPAVLPLILLVAAM